MWSCGSVLEGRKDGSGFTLSALRVRRKVDLCRQDWQTQLETLLGALDGLNARLENSEAMAGARSRVRWSAWKVADAAQSRSRSTANSARPPSPAEALNPGHHLDLATTVSTTAPTHTHHQTHFANRRHACQTNHRRTQGLHLFLPQTVLTATQMLRRGLVLDLSVAFGTSSSSTHSTQTTQHKL